jgi:hypothetical protein
MHMLSSVQVYRGLKSCPFLLENAGLRVPTRYVTHFSTPSASTLVKHNPQRLCYYIFTNFELGDIIILNNNNNNNPIPSKVFFEIQYLFIIFLGIYHSQQFSSFNRQHQQFLTRGSSVNSSKRTRKYKVIQI